MGKAARWLRSILAGKNRGRDKALPLPPATSPREKKRWSFRRAAQGKPAAALPSPLSHESSQSASGRELHEQAVARVTEAEEESDVLLARWVVEEEAAAARIQATFRGYLARKALCALRGLVKLQALIRGQVVRRQATATLRRMQALVVAQSRLRAQQARMMVAAANQRRSPQHPRRRSSYEMDHVKIVEMDLVSGEGPAPRGRSSCSAVAGHYYHHGPQWSPAPSSFAELSPRTHSGHLDDLLPLDPSDQGFVPGYMANTESSRAKQARSQSAPRQRTHDALDQHPSRRRGGGGGGAAPRKTMQRSASHIVAPCGYQYQYPAWAGVRLDRSSASLVGSECGSTSSVLTAATVAGYGGRSLVGFEVHNRAHY